MSPDPTSPSSGPAAARGAGRAPAVGALLAIVAIAAVSVNLRPAATSVGPLMDGIEASLGTGATASGLLTALPCLVFGLFGAVAVPIARRLGLTGSVVASFVLVAFGLLLRPTVDTFAAFLLLSVLGLIGPALGNVLVPAWIKLHGGARTVAMMTLYSVVLAIGGSAASALAVPLAGPGADGWRQSLGFWGMVAAVPVVIWAIVLTRTRYDFPGSPPAGSVPGSLLRSPTALALTLMFALQSTNAYTQFGLLPQVLAMTGSSAAAAGVLVSVVAIWGIAGGLVMPTVIARSRRLPWIVGSFGLITAAGYLGLLLLPQVAPVVWAIVLGIGGFAFPTAIALIPARSRDPLITARLSGLVQPVGYLLAAVGPVAAGALLDATGTAREMLLLMAGSGVLLAILGYRAALPRMVDDELARGPRG